MRRSLFRLELAFFGLTLNEIPQARLNLFTQIHEICFHGQGGYDWETVYNMPVWLRMFTFNKIKEYNENQTTAMKEAYSSKSNSTTLIDSEGNINKDQFKKLTNETLMNRNKS